MQLVKCSLTYAITYTSRFQDVILDALRFYNKYNITIILPIKKQITIKFKGER